MAFSASLFAIFIAGSIRELIGNQQPPGSFRMNKIRFRSIFHTLPALPFHRRMFTAGGGFGKGRELGLGVKSGLKRF